MFDKILQSNMCAGCGLCQSVLGKDIVEVKLDDSGYYRPFIKGEVTNEGVESIKSFCPAVVVKKDIENTPKYDNIWGEIYSCFIGAAKDESIRSEASSGGGISALLHHLLKSGKVDAIVHIGASTENPFINEVKISTCVEDIVANANSRYVASAPLVNIHEVLSNVDGFEAIAFVGKPCDVAALRQLSYRDELIKSKVKYYISFFCAGVPSVLATKKTVEALGVEENDVIRVDYRKEGWPGYFRVLDNKNNKYRLSYSLTWMKLLSPAVQFRCKVCPDGIGHFADIVCADGWDNFDSKGFPTFKNSPGKSLIISRTKIGDELLNSALSDGDLMKINNIDDMRFIDKMQPGQMSKKRFHLSRKLAAYIRTGYYLRSNKEFYLSATFTSSFTLQLKNFIGTLKRIN